MLFVGPIENMMGYAAAAQRPAVTWSPDPVDNVDVEERRLLPVGPWSMLGWNPSCLRACLVRWSLRMKHLSQSGHMKRFSPVCVRKCRVSSSERENFFAQSGQVQWKGLSPVCTLKCALRWDDLPYILPQPAYGQQCLFSAATRPDCRFRVLFTLQRSVNAFMHFSRFSLPPAWFSASLSTIHLVLMPVPRVHGIHWFRSSRIIATISRVRLSWLSSSPASLSEQSPLKPFDTTKGFVAKSTSVIITQNLLQVTNSKYL